MENKNLYKISKNLAELINSKELDIIYQEMITIRKNNQEFFNAKQLKSMEFIKIIFLIYSFKIWKDFIIGEDMIKNLYFFKIIKTDGEFVEEECEECGGGGTIQCDTCYGNNTVQCDECYGDGKIEDDDGDLVDCDNCDGEGDIECNNCGGDGDIQCYDCDGNGEMQTDKVVYIVEDCCYWKKEFMHYLIDSYELKEPIKNRNIIENNMSYLVFDTYELNFVEILEEDEYYCPFLSYKPTFYSEYSGSIHFSDSISNYFKK